MTIPDAAIEAAAETVYENTRNIAERRDVRSDPYPKWESLHPLMKDAMLESARAAIQAAMPAIREALAQEIEAHIIEGGSSDLDFGRDAGLDDAARIVRGTE